MYRYLLASYTWFVAVLLISFVCLLRTLGDAIVLARFMHALSQLYQGLPLRYAAPTFKKYYFPEPSCSVLAEFWPRMPHLHDTYFFSELGGKYADLRKNMEHLRWRFDTHDLAELRSVLSSRGQDEGLGSLSKQDCLTAYLVATLNDNRSIVVEKVTNASTVSSLYA